MTFVVFHKLPLEQTIESILKAEQWFREHPTRRVAKTDLFSIRRHHVAEDIVKHSVYADSTKRRTP